MSFQNPVIHQQGFVPSLSTHPVPTTSYKKNKKTGWIIGLFLVAFLFFALSVVMFLKGLDKVNNYNNYSEYGRESTNAYVGGDAYNYIINGTYATGYYVLSAGFLISGILCSGFGIVIMD